ncbi:MAG: carboxymuconolactone decarboxylase family protein [bacterium]
MLSDNDEFTKYRDRMDGAIMGCGYEEFKRYYAIDHKAYHHGVLPKSTKELLGLVGSLVLRCDDCVRYHIIHCKQENVSKEELYEALYIGLVVGGSVTIPHLRRAFEAIALEYSAD